MITVITVCYNEEKYIAATIESVLSQTYPDFEYIIKDGGSADGTVKIAESYRSCFEERGIPFKLISEPDKGLYDAMNIAVKQASGEWINFMNSGDCYFSKNVLSDIFEKNDWSSSDLLFGDTAEEEFGEYHYFRKCPEKIKERMPFSHQSVFARTRLMRSFPFDLKWKIGADYNFLLNAYTAGCMFSDTGVLIAKVSKTGVSSVRLKDTYLESIAIRRENGIETPSDEEINKQMWSINIRQFGMDYFPGWLKYWIRKVQRKLRHQKRVEVK